MRRIGLVVVSTVVALVSVLPAGSGPASGHQPERVRGTTVPSAASLAVTEARTVRLITGDLVRVLTRADGTSAARIVAGPHQRGPVARWRTPDGSSHLMPATPDRMRAVLDPSLFDVSRLADLPGDRVPIVVTLRPGAGVAAQSAVAQRWGATGDRSVTVQGSYGAGFGGLRARDLGAIRSIRLAGPDPSAPAAAPGAQHALTVKVRDGDGQPQTATVFIENVDDAQRYMETPVVEGDLTADVPEGDYALMAWSSSQLVVVPEIAITQDRTVTLDLSKATVRPEVSVPGHQVLEAVLSVGRSAETGFSFPVQFTARWFFMQVQPASGNVAHGELRTGVSAKLVPTGAADHDLAVTADAFDGIPADLTIAHAATDFTRVVDRLDANGPPGRRQMYVDATLAGVDLWTGREFGVRVPGRRVLLLQASPDISYQQTLMPQAPPRSDDLTQLVVVDTYPVAGRTHGVTFAHGPVGPGWEGEGPFFGVSRYDDRMRGVLPLFSGAGSAAYGTVDRADGFWVLRRSGQRIAGGRRTVFFDVAVPPRRFGYDLLAVSRPVARNWWLSTRVETRWHFHSAHGVENPALLTPSYVPPSSLSGRLRPGRTSFTLTFVTPPDTPRVAAAHVQLSTNRGRTWRPARVMRTGPTSFRVRYLNPGAGPAGRTMSLRVSGGDGRGNTVREVAIDVYRLR